MPWLIVDVVAVGGMSRDIVALSTKRVWSFYQCGGSVA